MSKENIGSYFGFRHSEESERIWKEYYKSILKKHKDPYSPTPSEAHVMRRFLINEITRINNEEKEK